MERFDIEHTPNTARNPMPERIILHSPSATVKHTGHWRDRSRFVSLRRYSTAICLIEALAIAFLVYLLTRLPSPSEQPTSASNDQQANVSNLNQPYHTYYSSKLGTSVTILSGLVPNCNQRRHDLSFSVQCRSSQADQCRWPYVGLIGDDVSSPSMAADSLIEDGKFVEVIETSKIGLRMEHRRQKLKKIECRANNSVDAADNAIEHIARCSFSTRIEIDRLRGHQKIIGWGGALTDSSISSILSLTVNGTRRLLDDYFGAHGLMFNMVRVTIGGSDFSARFYTNDDLEQEDDPSARLLKRFELKEEDYLYKIPILKMIKNEYMLPKRQIKFFASMWSPPVWMKTNRHFNKGQLRGAISNEPVSNLNNIPSDERFYDALSELKIKWLISYHEQMIDFWGLTVMNEPIFSVQPFLNFNTMIFPREDYANYVAKYLGPKLKQHSQTKQIKLMVHDDNRRYLMNFTKPILDQHRVRQFVDGISVHGYVDEEYSQMKLIYDMYKDIYKPALASDDSQQADDWFVLPTELCSGHLPFMEKALVGNWHRGVHYALDIIKSIQNSAAGWVDWNMALDIEGGPGWLGGRLDAPIIVDKSQDLYHKSPMFFVLGQFSRFIPPGSQRIETQVINGLYGSQFEVVSFKVERNKLATVIVNNNPYQIEVLLGAHESKGTDTKVYHLLECPADSVITVIQNY